MSNRDSNTLLYICNNCNKEYKSEKNLEKHLLKCSSKSKTQDIKSSVEKELGQFFTIDNSLQQFVFDNVKYKNSELLEPSFGSGHLLLKFKEYNKDYPMICYEIDKSINKVVKFNKYQTVYYSDFTTHNITKKFKTIIGNPPYVKKSKTNNLYIKFIELCYNLLDDKGELLFIVPSDFIKLTSASKLIETMTENGSFTHFLFPNNEKLFENASIDVLVFRYEKGLKQDTSMVIRSSGPVIRSSGPVIRSSEEKTMYININSGIITFSEDEMIGKKIEELFDVYVGIVSGKDEVYKNEIGNIEVLVSKSQKERFIYIESFPSENENINNYLLENKEQLLKRKIKKFTEKNWYEWGAPRNIKTVKENINKTCIYVNTITRNSEIAFIDKVQYFGGSLLCLIPKISSGSGELEGTGLSCEKLNKIVEHLNSSIFKKDYIYSGRFKIGHKQLSNAVIPL